MQVETPNSRPNFRRVILLTTLAAFVMLAPALLALISLLGVFGQGDAVQPVLQAPMLTAQVQFA